MFIAAISGNRIRGMFNNIKGIKHFKIFRFMVSTVSQYLKGLCCVYEVWIKSIQFK